MTHLQSYLLVILQFFALFLLYLGSDIGTGTTATVLAEWIGILLGLWAIVAMKFQFSVFPEAKKGQRLRTGGPYHFIRHPMYTALLSIGIGWFWESGTWVSALAYTVLVIVLLEKASREERQLVGLVEGYDEYMARTKRFLPFII